AVLTDGNIKAPILIVITDRAPPLFAIDFEATLLSINGHQVAVAIATKEEAAPCVAAAVVGVDRKEILSQQHIFTAVAIEISHGDPEGRRKLGLLWQRHRFEMVSAIEENHGLKSIGFQVGHFGERLAVNIKDTRSTVRLETRPFLAEEWERRADGL